MDTIAHEENTLAVSRKGLNAGKAETHRRLKSSDLRSQFNQSGFNYNKFQDEENEENNELLTQSTVKRIEGKNRS